MARRDRTRAWSAAPWQFFLAMFDTAMALACIRAILLAFQKAKNILINILKLNRTFRKLIQLEQELAQARTTIRFFEDRNASMEASS
jgi:hypothetical protein